MISRGVLASRAYHDACSAVNREMPSLVVELEKLEPWVNGMGPLLEALSAFHRPVAQKGLSKTMTRMALLDTMRALELAPHVKALAPPQKTITNMTRYVELCFSQFAQHVASIPADLKRWMFADRYESRECAGCTTPLDGRAETMVATVCCHILRPYCTKGCMDLTFLDASFDNSDANLHCPYCPAPYDPKNHVI